MPKLHAVVITADTTTGEATAIERLSLTRAALEAYVDSSEPTMPSLFDDAFEDDRPAEPVAEPPRAGGAAGDAGAAWPGRSAGTAATAADAAKPPARTIYTVSDLTAAVARSLEKQFFQVWVEGEISNARPASSGHLYFTLKDDTAQIKAVMFRGNLRLLRFKPADGQHVVARGQLEVYEARGEMQIVCQHLEPRGLGALQLAFEQLKRRLDAEGLFAAARKRPLPLLPRTIGIVTSLEGAAVRDIVRVITNRHAGLRLLIRPCRVQGDGACHEVARAIRDVSRHPGVDVVIVGPRRRLARGPVGLQRGSGGPRHRRLAGAGRVRRRARDRHDDRRLRRRRPRRDAVERRRDRGRAPRRAGAPDRAPRSPRPRRGAAARRGRPRRRPRPRRRDAACVTMQTRVANRERRRGRAVGAAAAAS